MAMTYLSDAKDPKAQLDIIGFNEEHFVFDKRMAFVTIEMLVLPYKETSALKMVLCCEVATEASHQINKKIDHNSYYPIIKPFFTDTQLDPIQWDGVYVFNRTFLLGDKLPTNTVYEDPESNIQVIQDDKIRIYNVEATVPSVEKVTRGHDEKLGTTTALITTTLPMQPKIVYAFRLGFWTWYDKKEKSSLLSGFNYHVRACACPHPDRRRKNSYPLGQCQDCNCRFWARTNSMTGLSELLNTLIKYNGNLTIPIIQELNHILTKPHSDIWIVVPKYWEIQQAGNLPIPITRKQIPGYLLYSKELDDTKREAFIENGIKLASFDGSNEPFIDPCKHRFIRDLHMSINPHFKIATSLAGHLIRFLSIPALYLAINTKEYLSNPSRYLIYAAILYLGSLIIDLNLVHRDFISYTYGYFERSWIFRKILKSPNGFIFTSISARVLVTLAFVTLLWYTYAKDPNADLIVKSIHTIFAMIEFIGVWAGTKIARVNFSK